MIQFTVTVISGFLLGVGCTVNGLRNPETGKQLVPKTIDMNYIIRAEIQCTTHPQGTDYKCVVAELRKRLL